MVKNLSLSFGILKRVRASLSNLELICAHALGPHLTITAVSALDWDGVIKLITGIPKTAFKCV